MKDGEIEKASAACTGRKVKAVELEEHDRHISLDVLRVRFEDGSALEVEVDYVERIKVVGPIELNSAGVIQRDGFYWYRDAPTSPWTIGRVDGDCFFYGCGTDEFESMPFAAGVLAEAEFVGPIEPPGAPAPQS